MNRRKFLASSVALPLAARSAMLDGKTLTSSEPDAGPAQQPATSAAALSGKPNSDRYHHTLNRVLHGAEPAYTQEFLLEDLRGQPGRRFTNFSGDLSGRWIGAL